MMNLSIALSGAALILSILSPVITAIINSYTQKREREAVFYLHHKADVIENYVRFTGQYIKTGGAEHLPAYGAAYGEIQLYISSELRCKITELNRYICRGKTLPKEVNALFDEICLALSEQAPRTKPPKRN